MTIRDTIVRNWDLIQRAPLHQMVYRAAQGYVSALLRQRRFYHPEVAQQLAEDAVSKAYELSIEGWQDITPEHYANRLQKAVQIQVKRFFQDFARRQKREAKAKSLWYAEITRSRKDSPEDKR